MQCEKNIPKKHGRGGKLAILVRFNSDLIPPLSDESHMHNVYKFYVEKILRVKKETLSMFKKAFFDS